MDWSLPLPAKFVVFKFLVSGSTQWQLWHEKCNDLLVRSSAEFASLWAYRKMSFKVNRLTLSNMNVIHLLTQFRNNTKMTDGQDIFSYKSVEVLLLLCPVKFTNDGHTLALARRCRITKNPERSTEPLARPFGRTANSFACSAALNHVLALSLTPKFMGKWMIRRLFLLCFFCSGP